MINNDRFKFRFWDIENKKFYTPKSQDEWIGVDDTGIYLYERDYSNIKEQVEVTDVTKYYEINQSTGLKDKNGNLIYEGDIIKIDGFNIGAVVFWRNQFCFESVNPNITQNERGHFNWEAFCKTDHSNYIPEIIGNIYGSPELLEVEND